MTKQNIYTRTHDTLQAHTERDDSHTGSANASSTSAKKAVTGNW